MKNRFYILIITLLILPGCSSGNKQIADDIIAINVNMEYPEKELILQDIFDVEYIPLETSDEFITQGEVIAVGSEIILITNRINDGDIFVFNRETGKALRKINRKGQGGEEYIAVTEIVLDEANNELFVIAYMGSNISVYDLYGNFKRSFNPEDADFHIHTFNYDRENLITYIPDNTLEDPSNIIHPYYLIFSKQDGSVTRKISIPFNEIKRPIAREGEEWAAALPTDVYQIIPNQGNWVFMDTSSDTTYHYMPEDNTTIPFIVRTPSIHNMDSPEVFLMPLILTESYYFMSALKAEFNFTIGKGFPSSVLIYDKQENNFFRFKIYNGDYTNKREVYMAMRRPLDQEIAFSQPLYAHELVEAYEEGELNGRLKEIAATLDEESNPVIMVVKHKNKLHP